MLPPGHRGWWEHGDTWIYTGKVVAAPHTQSIFMANKPAGKTGLWLRLRKNLHPRSVREGGAFYFLNDMVPGGQRSSPLTQAAGLGSGLQGSTPPRQGQRHACAKARRLLAGSPLRAPGAFPPSRACGQGASSVSLTQKRLLVPGTDEAHEARS